MGGDVEEPVPSEPLGGILPPFGSKPKGGRRGTAAQSGPDAIKPVSLDNSSQDDSAAREAKEQEERAAKAARMKKALGGDVEEPVPSQPIGDTKLSTPADTAEDDSAAREAKEQEERAAKAGRMKKAMGGDVEEPVPSEPLGGILPPFGSKPKGGRRGTAAQSGPDAIKPVSLDNNSPDDSAARE